MTAEQQEAGALLSQKGFRGEIYPAASAGYESCLKTWGMSPRGNLKRPLIAIRPRGTADCSLAVHWAQEQNFDIAVKGGGHSAANLSLVDGAVLLDLSLMRGVFVDPHKRTAAVEGGALLEDVDAETGLYKLAVPLGHVPTTGMGLPLCGGFGLAARSLGLACHHVIAYTLVTADGSVVVVDDVSNNQELLWGLNGAAAVFGIVTKIVFELADVSNFYGGMIMWKDDAEHQTWRKLAAWSRDIGFQNKDFNMPLYHVVQPGVGPTIAALVCYLGNESQKDKASFCEFIKELGPITDTVGAWSYAQTQNAFAPLALSTPKHYEAPAFVQLRREQVTDEFLQKILADLIDQVPRDQLQHVIIVFDSLGGQIKSQEGPVGFGEYSDFYLLGLVGWQDAENHDLGLAFSQKVKELGSRAGGVADAYSNLLNDPDAKLAMRCGGEDRLQRLRGLKKQWDPTNFFKAHPFHGL